MNVAVRALKAPFPYFGGKSRVAAQIWQALGDVPNYVEPFAGSSAVLLARPHDAPKTETINDADGYVSNFWRSVQKDPDAVATAADWPVNEIDLHARHYWLITEGRERLLSIQGDPEAYDAKIAGWWLHGICAWIGAGYCSGEGPWSVVDGSFVREGFGFRRKVPHLSGDGQGIHASGFKRKIKRGDQTGIHGLRFRADGDMDEPIHDLMWQLSDRLRSCRVASGDWKRVCGAGLRHGSHVGIFLDPPYAASDRTKTYFHDDVSVSAECRDWAISYAAEQGNRARIVFAGYSGQGDDEVFESAGWSAHSWKASGGYGNQGKGTSRGRDNAKRETLWLSPGCLPITS